MITYLDKALVLYPKLEGIVYWHSQYDGTPWEDLYDGLVWENKEVSKPTKEELDLVTDEQVLAYREQERKESRDNQAKKDINVVCGYNQYKQSNPDKSFSQYLDEIETIQKSL